MNAKMPETEVPLVVAGCDFRVASASWRNRLLLDPAQRAELSQLLAHACGAQGLVVLETCNRVEWIVAAHATRWAGEILRAQMVERWLEGQPSRSRLQHLPAPYVHTGAHAVQHLLRVAVGLESFVLGEREIAGQLNKALMGARTEGHASSYHNALQTTVGRTVRKVQRLTHWRHHSRGVHGLALEAIRRHLQPQLETNPQERPLVGVLGMGEIGRRQVAALAQWGQVKVLRFNRTVVNVHEGEWLKLTELPAHFAQLDVLVVATGSRQPTVDLSALPARQKPLLVVDLGAPHQVKRMAVTAENLTRCLDLDDLLTEPAASPNLAELPTVQELVEDGVREFLLELRKRELAGLLRAAHDAYDRHGYTRLPALIETELVGLAETDKRRVETAMRSLLRDMTREFVHHVEQAADAATHRAVKPVLEPK